MASKQAMIWSAAAAAILAGCTTTIAPSPVEVTRFHDSGVIDQIGRGTVFVETSPDQAGDSLEVAAYKNAIARELAQLGYRESARAEADHIARVSLERYRIGSDNRRRGPVSVGVGGSTGSYGSGVGVGIGFNLGGGKNRERVGTDLAVSIRDASGEQAIWEGRASVAVGRKSALAAAPANADIIAEALFRDFPGNHGETIEIEVDE